MPDPEAETLRAPQQLRRFRHLPSWPRSTGPYRNISSGRTTAHSSSIPSTHQSTISSCTSRSSKPPTPHPPSLSPSPINPPWSSTNPAKPPTTSLAIPSSPA
ncbi:hypothetical protein EJ03DRAFT_173416 [Teratosphaeria nubilosa]|uniref:Uncharacterized protein n=1 Tax=Teratosphaeria nubilosa TaxID=161662 RepID=A0A6G1L255_9PEZI|nr:hypothetical protein EJ03DRAFT_173416 [Teratosphaeria nubilosa]